MPWERAIDPRDTAIHPGQGYDRLQSKFYN